MPKRKDECKFCERRKCYTRIVTPDLRFDEVACYDHIRDLEVFADNADNELNGAIRMNLSSTGRLRRGDEYPSLPKIAQWKEHGNE